MILIKHQNEGFTLIEALVAVTVLMTAIVGPLTLATQSISSQAFSKNNLIAAALAQEGDELMRAYRDRNILRNGGDITHWLDGVSECTVGDGCGIDVTTNMDQALPSCAALPRNCTLYVNTVLNVYLHCNDTDPDCQKTNFKRKILVQETVPGVEIELTTNMIWQEKSSERTFSLVTHLLNW